MREAAATMFTIPSRHDLAVSLAGGVELVLVRHRPHVREARRHWLGGALG